MEFKGLRRSPPAPRRGMLNEALGRHVETHGRAGVHAYTLPAI